jgi:hypothetical protein
VLWVVLCGFCIGFACVVIPFSILNWLTFRILFLARYLLALAALVAMDPIARLDSVIVTAGKRVPGVYDRGVK